MSSPPFPCPTRFYHHTPQPSTSPTLPQLSAKGQSILITGGGVGGIGGETARSFALAGASRIAILGRRSQPLLDNKAFIEKTYPGVEVFAIPTDITNQSDVDAAFAQFTNNGTIHVNVLVTSAATVGPQDSAGIIGADGQVYLDTIHKNVAGALWVSKAFLRHAAEDAVVVAINSFASYWSAGKPIWSSYSVAKLAVFRLWDTVAIARPRVSVFHTQPGVVLTEMNLAAGGAKSFEGVETDDVKLPADFNVWLASPEARFLKGKFVWCNWDVEELKAQAEEIEKGTKFNIGLVGWPFDNGNAN